MKTDTDLQLVALIRDAAAQERPPSAAHRSRLKEAVLHRASCSDLGDDDDGERIARLAEWTTPKGAWRFDGARGGARSLVRQVAAFAAWGAGLGLAFAGAIEGRALVAPRTSPSSVHGSHPARTNPSRPVQGHRPISPPAQEHESQAEAEAGIDPDSISPRPKERVVATASSDPRSQPSSSADRGRRTESSLARAGTPEVPPSSAGLLSPESETYTGKTAIDPVAVVGPIGPFETRSVDLAKTDQRLRAELELMSEVQSALRDQQGARALRLIERHDAEFGQGQLQQERLAAEVFAACQVGDRSRARDAATRFLGSDRTSPLALRVQGACPFRNRSQGP